MKIIYQDNIRYEINPVPESGQGNTFLFSIRKTVFGDKDCSFVTQQREYFKRLYIDDNNDVYTSSKPVKKWFNWDTTRSYTLIKTK